MIARKMLGLALCLAWAPALADVNLQAPNGTSYTIRDTGGGELSAPGVFGSWPKLCVQACADCDQACGGGDLYDAGGAASAAELNNRQRAMAVRTIHGLDVQRRVYVPSAGQALANGFVRYLDTLTNNTGAPITVTVRVGSVTGNERVNNATTLWRTHSDDAVLETFDRWWVLDDDNVDAGSPSVAALVFGAGADSTPAAIAANYGGLNGAMSWRFERVAILPGTTAAFLTAVVVEPQRLAAIDEVDNLLRARDVELLDGMTPAQRNAVRNFDVSLPNASPIADAGGPYGVDEGGQVQLSAGDSFDPEGLPLQYAWDFDNDGQYDDAQGANAFATFPDNGVFFVGLRVTDAGGKVDTARGRVSVRNVAPVIRGVNTDQPIDEGDNLNVVVDAFDPGADQLTYEFDWTDSGAFEALGAEARHRYPSDGNYTLVVRVTDDEGDRAEQRIPVAVGNVPPEIFQVVTNSPTLENSQVNIQVIAQDAGGDPVTYEYDLDDDGVYEQSGVGLDRVSTSYPDDGLFRIRIRLSDDRGAQTVREENLSILNANPQIVSVANDGPVLEGSPVRVTITATDAGADELTYSFDFDDDGDFADDVSNSPQPVAEHVFRQQGNYVVGVQVRDDDNGRAVGNTEVVVQNAPPVIDLFELVNTPRQNDRFVVREGSPFTLRCLATDPGDDRLRYSFDLTGDGNYDIVDVPAFEQETSLPQQGDYTLRVRVNDGDGGRVEATVAVRVQNEIPVLRVEVASPQNEGAEVVIRAVAEDPGNDVLRYSFDFDGDGTFEIEDSMEAIARHTYPDQGLFRIRAVVDDGDNRVDATAELLIENVAPTVRVESNSPVPEGGELVLTAFPADPGDDTITLRWSVNGQDFERVVAGEADHTLTVQVEDDAIFNATVIAVDEDGGESRPAQVQVVVTNVAPYFQEIAVQPPAREGVPYNYVAPAQDAAGPADPLRFSLINPPAGVEVEAATGRLLWTPTYDQYLASPIEIRVRVDDGDGGTAETTLTVPVLPEDNDDDGIPDTYERNTCPPGAARCLSPDNADDADEDFDGDGLSNREEFENDSSPYIYDGPPTPELVEPEEGERITTLTPTFVVSRTESPLEGAEVFIEIEIYADANLQQLTAASDPIALPDEGRPSWTVEPFTLFEDVDYYWRARAVSGPAVTEWTRAWRLRTNSENTLPTPPVLRAPADGAVVDVRAPVLEALPSQDPDGDEVQYIFRIYDLRTDAAVGSGSGVLQGDVVRFDTGTTSVAENGMYAWDVVARDGVGVSEPSERWSFTINTNNDLPTAPRIVAPEDGSMVDSRTPTFVAEGSTDADNPELSYEFKIRLRGGSDYLVESEPVAAVDRRGEWTPTDALAEDTWHAVDVRATDGIGTSTFATAEFFVSENDDPPSVPVPLSPDDGGQVVQDEAFITWAEATDPEEGDVLYVVELCNGSDCRSFDPLPQEGYDLTRIVEKGQTYTWRVEAQDGAGNKSG
ncbi:MAG: PKD domain-containing protein, partial [Myxococcales bacterium]|nr:PKD domain-containing protein [Myxococcales bacterium]